MGSSPSKRVAKPIIPPLPSPRITVDIQSPIRSYRLATEDCQTVIFDDLDEELLRSVFLTDHPDICSEPSLLVQAEMLAAQTNLQTDFEYERTRLLRGSSFGMR